VSETDFLEAVAAAAAADVPAEVAGIVKDAVIAVEKTQLLRAVNDYERIRRVKTMQARPVRSGVHS
jgi:hypothetical protein